VTVRNLEFLFRPRTVALIGASDREGSVGSKVMRNLLDAGFGGAIWPVNPKHSVVAGLSVYGAVADLPAAPDLAVICTPPATVPKLIAELGERGTRAAIVLTAGLAQGRTEDGRTFRAAMLDAARPHLLRILGPNCVGLVIPGMKLNASFAPAQALPGKIAFVSQSGALATAMLEVLQNTDLRSRMTSRATEYSKIHSWKRRKTDYLNIVDDLVTQRGNGRSLMGPHAAHSIQ